jgi:anthranilate phosphoribosyltransferase
MAIAHYIKEIGRGKEGARSLARDQATDLMGQVLDGKVSDLEIGAFCIAMRIKGETPQEMAGFLDAVHARMQRITCDQPVIVIPSYNGARKLPGLTTLLAALLAREGAKRAAQPSGKGFAVLIHGCTTENSRVPTQAVHDAVFSGVFKQNMPPALIEYAQGAIHLIASGMPSYVPTQQLSPALQRLLDVRRTVGLRNPAHSLVKLMNPTLRTPNI